MSDDVLITPASRKVEFFDNGGNIDGKIELDSNGNLNITSTGSIAIGDITQDIHVGDGTQAVDLVFDFTSSIYSVANQDLTIGKKSLGGNDILIESPSPVRVSTASGYIDVGPANTGYAHIQTDRTRFYFNKPLIIDGGNTNGDAYLISSYNTEDFVIATNNGAEDRITIKQATGNVGIGVIAPTEQLCVRGGIKIGEFNDADGTGYGSSAAPNSANLGTGAQDPQLRVSGRASDQPGIIQMAFFDANNFFGGTTEFTLGRLQYAMNENSQEVTTVAEIRGITGRPNVPGHFDGALTFWTSDGDGSGANLSEKMILTPQGHVGIGTTSPDTLFEIKEDGTGPAVMRLRSSNTSYPDDTAFGRIEFYNADASGAGVTAKINAISDASGRGGQLQFQTDDTGTSPQTALLLQGDLNAVFAGNVASTSANNYNLYWPLYFQRDNMGTSNIDMRMPVGGAGTSSPNSMAMPRAGKIMALTLHYYGGTLSTSSSKSDTWRIRHHSGGTADVTTEDIVVTMDTLVATSNANQRVKTIELSTPLVFAADDAIGFRRNANAGSNSIHEVAAVIWCHFDA